VIIGDVTASDNLKVSVNKDVFAEGSLCTSEGGPGNGYVTVFNCISAGNLVYISRPGTEMQLCGVGIYAIPCPTNPTTISWASTIATPHTYVIGSATLTTPLYGLDITPLSCFLVNSYVFTKQSDGLAASYLSANTVTGNVELVTTDRTLHGTSETVDMHALLDNMVATSPVESFVVNFLDVCVSPSLTTMNT